MTPGERIKILRMLAGFTQEKLGEISGLNRASIVYWEKGTHIPSTSAASALGKVLSCSHDYILFGNSPPRDACWEPVLPKSRKFFNIFCLDFESLFPAFCTENEINFCTYYTAENGKIVFLGKKNQPLSFLLFLHPFLYECFIKIFASLDGKEISALNGYPQTSLGFTEKKTIDSLSFYYNLFSSNNIQINWQAINKAFLKARKFRWPKSEEDQKGFRKNAFIHVLKVLHEFEYPDHNGSNHNYSQKIFGNLYDVFEYLNEKFEEESLAYSGSIDEELADTVRKLIKGLGFKKKSLSSEKDDN